MLAGGSRRGRGRTVTPAGSRVRDAVRRRRGTARATNARRRGRRGRRRSAGRRPGPAMPRRRRVTGRSGSPMRPQPSHSNSSSPKRWATSKITSSNRKNGASEAGDLGTNAVGLGVDLPASWPAHAAPRSRTRSCRAGTHRCRRRRERWPSCIDLGVETHPPAVQPRLDDDVVVMPSVDEVAGEPHRDRRRCRGIAGHRHRRGVVSTAALHAVGHVSWLGRAATDVGLVSSEDVLEPASVDLVAGRQPAARGPRPDSGRSRSAPPQTRLVDRSVRRQAGGRAVAGPSTGCAGHGRGPIAPPQTPRHRVSQTPEVRALPAGAPARWSDGRASSERMGCGGKGAGSAAVPADHALRVGSCAAGPGGAAAPLGRRPTRYHASIAPLPLTAIVPLGSQWNSSASSL